MSQAADRDRVNALQDMANRLSRSGAWHWDVASGRVTWTTMLYEIFEIPQGTEITLETALQSHTPESRQRLDAAIARCLEHHEPYDLRLEFIMPSGRHVWARAHGLPEFDKKGETVTGLFGSFQDISAEVRAETEREAARLDLEYVLSGMPDGFFLLDADWKFRFVNAASENMLRQTPEALVGRNIWDVFPEAIGSTFWDRYHAVRDTNTSDQFVEYFPPLDIWFEVAAHPARTGIAVHFRDVSSRIRERQELRLLRTAVENLAVGVLILDGLGDVVPQRRVIYANEAAKDILHRTDDDLHTLSLAEVAAQFAADDDTPDWADRVQNGETLRRDVRIRAPGGTERVLDTFAAPLRGNEDDAQGGTEITHAVLILDDVTDQRNADEAQRRSDRLALLGQMAGGVSHDFNNLLAVIMGNIELLGLTDDMQEAGELRREALDAVQRGKMLNDSLLAFAGRAHIEPSTADLGEFVASLSGILRRTLPSNVSLEVIAPKGLPPVLIDIGMAESCLLNLVLNAREAARGGGAVRVEVASATAPRPHMPAAALEPWITLSVSDDGVGIPQDMQETVFDPFFTTRPVGEGSGLGLSRVRGYLEQLGGFVTLDSALGEGTRITMHFPVATVDDRPTPQATAATAPVGSGRILLVDDTRAVAKATQRLLKSLGYTVVTCFDGDAAEAAFLADPAFDCLVTDVVMPGRTGIQLISDLRRINPDLRVVLISGYPQSEIAADSLDERTVFLGKPVTRAALGTALQTLF